MDEIRSSRWVRIKKFAKKRPDSLKIDLLGAPINCSLRNSDISDPCRSNIVNITFRNIGYSIQDGFFSSSKYKF